MSPTIVLKPEHVDESSDVNTTVMIFVSAMGREEENDARTESDLKTLSNAAQDIGVGARDDVEPRFLVKYSPDVPHCESI
uniref:AlNc14C45G3692 protein n=1 Tax=Albugo laibachii Nc14 TaxID=890382 RepID=F0WAG5_9STRA|nr:AlNc14C45G3692 [Albugo laibachii Nc14]|eukprot:CCA18136.1 AlNc14C45G3692 [Albugo laibachii Nc14]